MRKPTFDENGEETTPLRDTALKNLDFLGLFSMLCEALRRTYWAILRVENEFHNNFE